MKADVMTDIVERTNDVIPRPRYCSRLYTGIGHPSAHTR
jgi:hypothetical protein